MPVIRFSKAIIFCLLLLGGSVAILPAQTTPAHTIYQDVYFRETAEAWVFGNREVTLAFNPATGAWQGMTVKPEPASLISATGLHQTFDFIVDTTRMVEKHGATLLRHYVQIDPMREGVSLELVYGVLPRSGTPNGYEYEAICRFTLVPAAAQVKRSAQLVRQPGGDSPAYRKMNGFVFEMPHLVIGKADECVFDVPGPFFPKTFLRPETPLGQLAGRSIRFHNAPDAGFGILSLDNQARKTTVAAWMETAGEVTYFPALTSDGKDVSFSFTNDRTYRLPPAGSVSSDVQRIQIGTSLPDVLSAYRRMCEAKMPLDPHTPDAVRDMVILEVYPAYFPDGFKGITRKLPFYKEAGINTVYLMPHWKGGYSPLDFYEVDSRYGTANELKELVRTAHSLGMKFFFDMVIHGFNEKSPVVGAHPELFVHDERGKPARHPTWKSITTDWASPAYQQYMADLALHHAKTYGIDGYRLDAATYKGPSWDPGLPYPAYRSGSAAPELMERMLAAMHTVKPEAVMLSEVFGPVFYTVSNLVHDNQAESPQLVLEKMEKGEYTARNYKLHLRNVMLALPKGANRVYYTRNHDTSWFFHFNGYTPRFMAMESVHALCAIPEIFAGDPKHGPNPDDSKATFDYYRKLFSLRRDYPELCRGELLLQEVDSDNPMVFTALRSLNGKLSLVVVSLSDKEENVTVTVSPSAAGGKASLKAGLLDGITRQPLKSSAKGNVLTLKTKPYQVVVGRF